MGFTVSKGVCNYQWKNRYSMTSLSSNVGAFAGIDDQEPEKLYPDEEWRDEIMRTCDAMLTLEGDIYNLGLDMNAVCEDILQYKASENEFWQSVKNTYWPCHNLPLSTTAQNIDDEWEED